MAMSSGRLLCSLEGPFTIIGACDATFHANDASIDMYEYAEYYDTIFDKKTSGGIGGLLCCGIMLGGRHGCLDVLRP